MSGELRLFVVEDDPVQASNVRRALEESHPGCQVRVAGTLEEFRREATADPPDLALVDLHLPDGSATEILPGKPESGLFPILVMTAHGSEQIAVETLRHGALDYVVKTPKGIQALGAAVDRARREWRLRIEASRTQAALAASEARYRLFVESANVGIWAMDHEFRTTFVNAKTCAMLGHTREEMIGRQVMEFLFAEDQGGHQNEMPKHSAGHHGQYERRFRRKDGSACWATVSSTALRAPDGPFGGSLATLTDITEQKRTEEHRRVLAELLDICPASVTVHDYDGNFLYVNERTLRYHGYDRDEFMTLNLHALDVPESAALIGPRIEQMLREGEASFEVAHFRRDGSTFPLLVQGRVAQWEGRPVVLSVAADVTEQKQREKELLELKAAVDQAADGVAIADLDGTIHFVNPSWAAMHGYAPEELIGTHLGVFHSTEQMRVDVKPFLERLLLDGRLEGEIGHRHRDRRLFPTWMSVTVLKDSAGRRSGMLAVARDITERKAAEEQILRSRHELQEANRRLEAVAIQAREMARRADAANAAKSEFLANMSHEIRTPLNGIIGMTGILLDAIPEGETRRYAETVQSCSETLLRLVNDLLDFARIEAGKLDLESIPFHLGSCLHETLDILAPAAEQKGLELTSDVSADVPVILRGDPGRLRQIVLNLAGNAIKFTERGSVEIQAGVDSQDDRHVLLRVEVRDTGIGIPPDRLDSLFAPFTQVDGSTTRKYGGTGLGLAIVCQLAGLMGGSAGVESREGEGSTFWFTAMLEHDEMELPSPPDSASCPAGRETNVDADANQDAANPLPAGGDGGRPSPGKPGGGGSPPPSARTSRTDGRPPSS